MNRTRSLLRWRTAQVVLLCAALSGCGQGQGEVSGIVRYQGQPLPFGTIQFLGRDGLPYAGPIGPDGTFCVQVPAGAAKVMVHCVYPSSPPQNPAPPLASGRAVPTATTGQVSLIPPRYTDWNTSGLAVLVERGQNVQDFALTAN
jgi:hypothetical protein